MKKLLKRINELRNSEIRKTIDGRLKEFKLKNSCDDDIFSELCFCIMTANYTADKSIKIQNLIGNGFSVLPEKQLAKKLKVLGHRFPNMRAKYIVAARMHKNGLKNKICSFDDEKSLRNWIAENITGLGYKEASHFLRNIGYENLAIIDFHIVDILSDYGLIDRPKTLTKKKYFEIEDVLDGIAKKAGMNLAELDLYLWYCETGKVLK